MNNYNPMLEYQRNQLLAQQAMIQQQLTQLGQPPVSQPHYTPNPEPPTPQYFVREVASFEDVKRVPPDPCATYLFPDTTTGKIYMKRLNSDTGRSEYFVYSLEDAENESSDPIAQMNARLERIEMILGGKNESVSENGTNATVCAESDERNTKSNASKNAKTKSADVPECAADDKR